MGGVLAKNILIFTCYWFVSHSVFSFFTAFGMPQAPLWPAAAIALVGGLALGKKAAPGLYLGSVMASAISLNLSWTAAAMIGVMNTLSPIISAKLINRHTDRRSMFESLGGLAAFLAFGVVLHAALAAAGGIGTLYLCGKIAFGHAALAWFGWLVADAGGVLFFAPVIILWLNDPKPDLPSGKRLEVTALTVILASSTLCLFFTRPPTGGAVADLLFLLMVPLAWAAVRFELRESYTIFCLILVLAQVGTIMGRGPFVSQTYDKPLLAFGLMGISFSFTVLVLAVLGTERKQAEKRLREHNETLEQTVGQRTADLKCSKITLEENLSELGVAQETILSKQYDLQKSERLLNETGSTAKVGGWEMDLVTQKVTRTDEVYRIYEVDRDFEPSLENILEFYVQKDRKLLRAAINSAIERGQDYDLELELVTAKGKILWVRILGKISHEKGETVRMSGTIQDISRQKETEEALKRSERFNKSIIDNSQDCIKVLDRDGTLRFMSPGGLRLFELNDLNEILGKPYAGFWQNVKNIEIERYLEKVRQGGKASFQGFLPTLKGTAKWWDVAMSPIRNSLGKVESILVVSRDITPLKVAERGLLKAKETLEFRVEERTANLRKEVEMRRQAQEALAESEIYVRSVLDSLSAHVAVLDENASIIEANRPWVQFAEVAGVRSNPQFLHWDYLEICRKAADGGGEQSETARAAADGLEKVMAGELNEFVVPYYCPGEDAERWFNLRVTRLSGSDPVRYVMAHEDITNVIAAQRALSESEERYRLVAETMGDMVCMHDREGRFSFVSPSAAKLVGYEPGELLGAHPLDFIQDRDSHLLLADTMARIVSRRETLNVTYRWHRPDGSWIWLETIASPVLGEDGEVSGIVASSRDVSKRVEAEQRAEVLAKFPEENPNPVLRVNSGGEIQYANRASQWLLDELVLCKGKRLPAGLWKRISSLSRQQGERSLEEDLGPRCLRWTIAPTADSESIYLYAEDVTQQKYFHQQQQMVAKVFEQSVEGIIIADNEGMVQMVNRAFSIITGFEPEDALGKEMNVLRADRHSVAFMEELWKELTESGQWTGEYWNRRKDGEAYPEWLTLSIIKNESGGVMNYVAIFYDITEIKRSQEEIHYQAHHDALTGLPNRLLLEDRLAQALHRSERNSTKVAMLFLDLDNFKRINDSLGHELGDEILKKTGSRLLKCIREVDTVARLGGDEFIVVLTDVEERGMVVRVAGRLLESFKRPFVLQGRELLVGVSIGITIFPDDANDAGELMRNADMAMYQAKEGGRNNYQLFARAMHQEATRKMELETELRRGLDHDEFILHYQPKVSLATGQIVGMEALVRWRRASGKVLMPDNFIDVAEESGLIVPLGRVVLQTACQQAKAWLDAGLMIGGVSVNLSPKQFQQKDLLEMVETVLHSSGLPPEFLELEIIETTVMRNVDAAVDTLGRLSRFGISFSVDDFGTGYSSLYYLKRFPIGTLKIDRSFVRDIEQDPNDRTLVEAIITMSHTLNLKVVAEGVETPWQFRFLRMKNCDQAQGYLLSKPLPAKEIERMLISGKRFEMPWAGTG